MKYFLSKLTIYNFTKNKIKFDYSILPIENIHKDGNKTVAKSGTSEEFIIFDNDNIYNPIFVKKDDDGNKISRVLKLFSYQDNVSLDKVEEYINYAIYNLFMKKFKFRFKHKKVLKKKVAIGQFKISK